jgi:hypothetical protein
MSNEEKPLSSAKKLLRSEGCMFWVQSVMKAGGLTISCADVPDARVIPGHHSFLSLEDDLMRLFGGDNIASLMDRFRY